MKHARYENDRLFIENTDVHALADEFGTPLYVYSQAQLMENFSRIEFALAQFPHVICYAVKANSNPRLLELLAGRGCGADVVSLGELRLALRAGIPPEKIVFAGVGKRDDEIVAAIETGIRGINVESEMELKIINGLAAAMGKSANVSLRVNPDIDIHGHPYITTGLQQNKFGIPQDQLDTIFRNFAELPHVKLVGLHAHLGSQIMSTVPYKQLSRVMRTLYAASRRAGHNVDFLDLGGGLGVVYENLLEPVTNAAGRDDFALEPEAVVRALMGEIKDLPVTVLFEPGRAMVANAGVLLTRVLYLKQSGAKRFIIVDAGMTELIRPSLYNAYHEILPARLRSGPAAAVDVVGPICESSDFLARERRMLPVERGDVLAVMTTGAYGFTLSSNYNARLRPAEILLEGDRSTVIRARQSLQNLWG